MVASEVQRRELAVLLKSLTNGENGLLAHVTAGKAESTENLAEAQQSDQIPTESEVMGVKSDGARLQIALVEYEGRDLSTARSGQSVQEDLNAFVTQLVL